MVGVGSYDGGGRRLPPWMGGASSANRDEKSDNSKVTKKPLQEGLSPQVSHPGSRTKKIRHVKESPLLDEENKIKRLNILEKCNTKRRKLKEKQEDADSDFNVSERDRIQGKLPRCTSQKRLKMNGIESSKELGIRPVNEDEEDVELTVEDLMTIAREYVRGDNNSVQDHALKRTTVTSTNESSDNIGARTRNVATTTHEICVSRNHTKDVHDTSTSSVSELKTSLSEEFVMSTSRTGDPAQDMLDLLLGPLLKKPTSENKMKYSSDDVAFVNEIGIQNKTNTVGEEIAPAVTKKKSSLKDKIAMFL